MPNSAPVMYSKDDGLLTLYGLHCGYVEQKELGVDDVKIRVEMYEEHQTIHVRGFLEVEDEYARIDNNDFGRLFWKSFDSRRYDEALAFYKSFGVGTRILRSIA